MRHATGFLASGLALTLFVGLGTLSPAQAAGPELIQNGGFETGNFTGFTQFGNTGFTGVTTSFSGVASPEGTYQAFFGAVNSPGGIMQQTVGTTAGKLYDVSFYLYNFGGTPNSASVQFGTTNLLTLTNAPQFNYTQFSYTVAATSSQTTLSFAFQQNPSYFLLDDVSVRASAVPELSTMLGFGGFAALGGLAMFRQRKASRKVA